MKITEEMKYESFYKQYDALQKKDIAELKRCLQHHGGKFSWNDNPDVEKPIIAVNTDFGCGDVRVGDIGGWIEGKLRDKYVLRQGGR